MNWWTHRVTRAFTLTLALALGGLEFWALQRARWSQRRALPKV